MAESGVGKSTGGLRVAGAALFLSGFALGIYTWRIADGRFDGDEILFRAVMSGVIAGIGGVLVLLGGMDGGGEGALRALSEQHPGQPWRWREDWERGFAVPEQEAEGRTRAAMGAICVLLSAPIALALPREVVDRHNYGALVGLVFPIVGLYLIGYALLAAVRARRYRNVRFVAVRFPGVTGGRVSGRVEGEFALPEGTSVEVTLSCVRSYVSGSGSRKARWQRVLWQDRNRVAGFGSGQGTHVPVEFRIPSDVKATDLRNPDDQIVWRVSAAAEVPGADFRFSFGVPVCETAESDAALTAAVLQEERAKSGGARAADSKIVDGRMEGGGVSFYLPAGRTKGMAAVTGLFAMACLGPALFFGAALGRSWLWVLALIPLLVTGGAGILLGCISVWLWFGATKIEVAGGALRIRSSCLGFSRERTVRAEQIRKMELASGMQRGEEVWYDVKVHLANGRRVTAGSGLEKAEADWLLARLKAELAA